MMNPYQQLVFEYTRLNREGKTLPLGTFPIPSRAPVRSGAPKVLIFSPHPDEECILGGIALRLLRQSGWPIINVAVTQGSKKERQAGRLQELKQCCEYLGFDLIQTAPAGLERVNPKARAQDPGAWNRSVKIIADILIDHQPRAILFPHSLDWNSTHVGTHLLVTDALQTLASNFSCFTIETEFWGAMADPNLMVQLAPELLGEMITALTFHVGEVSRNPYHLSLPAWMMDNVRRGAELVGGQGGAAPDYPFATLYRLRKWQDGKLVATFAGGKQLTARDNPAALFA